jgi:hypothetical protein
LAQVNVTIPETVLPEAGLVIVTSAGVEAGVGVGGFGVGVGGTGVGVGALLLTVTFSDALPKRAPFR